MKDYIVIFISSISLFISCFAIYLNYKKQSVLKINFLRSFRYFGNDDQEENSDGGAYNLGELIAQQAKIDIKHKSGGDVILYGYIENTGTNFIKIQNPIFIPINKNMPAVKGVSVHIMNFNSSKDISLKDNLFIMGPNSSYIIKIQVHFQSGGASWTNLDNINFVYYCETNFINKILNIFKRKENRLNTKGEEQEVNISFTNNFLEEYKKNLFDATIFEDIDHFDEKNSNFIYEERLLLRENGYNCRKFKTNKKITSDDIGKNYKGELILDYLFQNHIGQNIELNN